MTDKAHPQVVAVTATLGQTPTSAPELRKLTPVVGPTKIVSGDSVEALRRADAVRELQPLEDSKSINSLPAGVYGFAAPWTIDADGGPGVDRKSLRRSPFETFVMEVHKRETGEIYIVGYVSESDLARLQNSSRTSDTVATLFFSP